MELMELTEEEKQMVRNWPERAIAIGIKKLYGFEMKEVDFVHWDNVIITEAPPELKSVN